jgi:hypothetical protein
MNGTSAKPGLGTSPPAPGAVPPARLQMVPLARLLKMRLPTERQSAPSLRLSRVLAAAMRS